MSIPLRALNIEDSEEDALLLVRELKLGGYNPEVKRVCTPEDMRAALNGGRWDVSDIGLCYTSVQRARRAAVAQRYRDRLAFHYRVREDRRRRCGPGDEGRRP